MRELSFIEQRLQEVEKELGVSNYAGFLQESRQKISNILAKNSFYVDVYQHSASSKQAKSWVNQLISGNNTVNHFFIKDENTATQRVFKEVLAATAFIIFDETFQQSQALQDKFAFFASQYRLVCIINFIEPDVAKNFSRSIKYPSQCQLVEATTLSDLPVNELIQQLIPEVAFRNALQRYSYINSVQPLFPALDQVFATENKVIQTRKLLNGQNVQILRKDEQSANQSEMQNTIRQMIQKFGQDSEKILRSKYDDLNKPITGKFSKVGIKQAESIQDFHKEDLAEKNEKVAVSLQKEQVSTILNTVSDTLLKEMDKDVAHLQTSLDDLFRNINGHLQAKGWQPLTKQDIEQMLPKSEKVVSSYCYMSRTFSGEIVKKGVTEYFIALRDYIGVIMVATGLLAPLNMIATLGDEKESFFSFLKHLNVIIKFSTATICICLIIYGIFDLRRRIPLKRAEELHKELTKARELLLNECRRIFNDSSRDWSGALATWVREISQHLNQQVDKSFKQFQQDKQYQLNQDRVVQQRQQQSIDLIQKNIQSAERIKDAMATKFREFITETEKELRR